MSRIGEPMTSTLSSVKQKEFKQSIPFKVTTAGLLPTEGEARDFCYQHNGSEVFMKPATNRDLKFHRCYFKVLDWLWWQMPLSFKKRVEQKDMYLLMKLIRGQYKVTMQFKDIKHIEYDSISFGKMNEEVFKDYVNDSLTAFLNEILIPMNLGHIYDESIEEFEGFYMQII